MTEQKAAAERVKLLGAKKHLTPKRGYLVYVARYGAKRALHGKKGKGAHYFFEVPLVLSQEMDKAELKQWRVEFRCWSQYVKNPETHA
jgi:hypothetical protein